MCKNMQRILFLIALSVFCISCMGPNITIKGDTVYEQTIAKMDGEYLLGSGDVVEIIYHVEPQPSEKEYIFAVGDVVGVEFYYHPEINRNISIRTDGKISLPLKEDINAAGLFCFTFVNNTVSTIRRQWFGRATVDFNIVHIPANEAVAAVDAEVEA